jgi:hypothetical protein
MIERKCEIAPLRRDLLRPLVNTMLAVKPRVREILEGDLDAIGAMLTRGFVHRGREYWMRGLHRRGSPASAAERTTPRLPAEASGRAGQLPAADLFDQLVDELAIYGM